MGVTPFFCADPYDLLALLYIEHADVGEVLGEAQLPGKPRIGLVPAHPARLPERVECSVSGLFPFP
jgi:hypothetical protein